MLSRNKKFSVTPAVLAASNEITLLMPPVSTPSDSSQIQPQPISTFDENSNNVISTFVSSSINKLLIKPANRSLCEITAISAGGVVSGICVAIPYYLATMDSFIPARICTVSTNMIQGMGSAIGVIAALFDYVRKNKDISIKTKIKKDGVLTILLFIPAGTSSLVQAGISYIGAKKQGYSTARVYALTGISGISTTFLMIYAMHTSFQQIRAAFLSCTPCFKNYLSTRSEENELAESMRSAVLKTLENFAKQMRLNPDLRKKILSFFTEGENNNQSQQQQEQNFEEIFFQLINQTNAVPTKSVSSIRKVVAVYNRYAVTLLCFSFTLLSEATYICSTEKFLEETGFSKEIACLVAILANIPITLLSWMFCNNLGETAKRVTYEGVDALKNSNVNAFIPTWLLIFVGYVLPIALGSLSGTGAKNIFESTIDHCIPWFAPSYINENVTTVSPDYSNVTTYSNATIIANESQAKTALGYVVNSSTSFFNTIFLKSIMDQCLNFCFRYQGSEKTQGEFNMLYQIECYGLYWDKMKYDEVLLVLSTADKKTVNTGDDNKTEAEILLHDNGLLEKLRKWSVINREKFKEWKGQEQEQTLLTPVESKQEDSVLFKQEEPSCLVSISKESSVSCTFFQAEKENNRKEPAITSCPIDSNNHQSLQI